MKLQIHDGVFIEINTQNGTYLQYAKTIIAHRYYNHVVVNKLIHILMPEFGELITTIIGPSQNWIAIETEIGKELEAL